MIPDNPGWKSLQTVLSPNSGGLRQARATGAAITHDERATGAAGPRH